MTFKGHLLFLITIFEIELQYGVVCRSYFVFSQHFSQILMTFDAGFIIPEIWFYPSLLYKWPAQDVWNSAALLPVYFFWKEPARYLFPFCSSWIVWIYCNYPKNLSTKQEFHQENVPADLDETPQITKCLGKITEIMKIIWT